MILIQSFLTGKIVEHYTKLELSEYTLIPIGFFVTMGLVQVFIYFNVTFHLPIGLIYSIYLVLFLFSLLWFLKKKIKFFIRLHSLGIVFLSLVYVAFMLFNVSKYDIGSNGFDAIFYLSVVTQNSVAKVPSSMDYYSGLSSQLINPTYAYQSYYIIGSMFLFLYDKFNAYLSPYQLTINSHIFIWLFSALYFFFNSLLVYTYINSINIKSKFLKILLIILFLFFFSNLYFNNVFAFFGNTYRTLVVGLILFILYILMNRGFNLSRVLLLTILFSSLISFSSSGFFILVLIEYALFVVLLIHRKDPEVFIYLGIITIPVLQFALFYLFNTHSLFVITGFFVYLVLVVFILKKNYLIQLDEKSIKFLSIIFYAVIPLCTLIISGFILSNHPVDLMPFFSNHSNIDMVWDYFNFRSFPLLVINSLIILSLIYFFITNKSNFQRLIFLIILTFVNPFSYAFIYQFLSSLVYYRSFDIIFNEFVLILAIASFLASLTHRVLKYGIISVLIVLLVLFSKDQTVYYYHMSFVPSDTFNPFVKLDQDEYDVMNQLKTKINLESYEKAIVVSQIEGIIGYVPNIVTPIPYNQYRTLNRYVPEDAPSELMNIFVKRDYYNQAIFKQEPDYKNTCKYLIEENIDFIVVDKRQYFVDETGYVHLYFLVRECAEEIYVNETFALFQFYWK